MMITTLHVNLTSYVLHDEVDADRLATSIELAARDGGAFVPVRTADGVERSVLITPALVVEIEPVDVGDERPQAAIESSGSATFSGLDVYSPAYPSYFAW